MTFKIVLVVEHLTGSIQNCCQQKHKLLKSEALILQIFKQILLEESLVGLKCT